MNKGRRRVITLLLALTLAGGSYVLRGHRRPFITWDEPAWVYRTLRFSDALAHRDWSGTLVTGHPGVTLMWSGAASLFWETSIEKELDVEQLREVVAQPWQIHDPDLLRSLGGLLPRVIGVSRLWHALFLMLIYGLLAELLGPARALPAAAMLMLDPYYLGLSRLFHLDALTGEFMLLSLLTALLYVRSHRRLALAASGLALALAFLTKAYGLFVAPIVLVLLTLSEQRATSRATAPQRPAWLAPMVTWTLALVVTLFALWPAMWVDPLQALGSVLGLASKYATEEAGATATFFLGAIRKPGAAFYPLVLWFRLTPLALLGGGFAVLSAIRRKEQRPLVGALLGFALLHLFLLSLGLKKFDRYAIPSILSLDLLGGLGLIAAAEGLWRRVRPDGSTISRVPLTLCLLLIGGQGIALTGTVGRPYLLAYYNPLAGGLERAIQTLPVGYGEGIDQVVNYLNDASDPSATVATWSVAGVAPLFRGQVVTPTLEGLVQSEYALVYVGDLQAGNNLARRFYGHSRPEFVARVGNVPLAYLYRNAYWSELQETLCGAGQPHLVVSNLPSAAKRHLTCPMTWWVIGEDQEEEIGTRLQGAIGAGDSVFYVRYHQADEGESLRRRLAQASLLLSSSSFRYGTLYRFVILQDRFTPTGTPIPADAIFGETLQLLHYGLSNAEVAPRQEIEVALEWLPSGEIPEDYHLFLHLLDAHGRKWGQFDAPLRDVTGQPPTQWTPKGVHLSRYSVALFPAISPGDYRLVMGLYRLEDGVRLPIRDTTGQVVGTEYPLQRIRVQPPRYPASIEEIAIPRPLELPTQYGLRLLGYDIDREEAYGGEQLLLTLYWLCEEPPVPHLFFQLDLYDQDQSVFLGRYEPVPAYPTSHWPSGAVFGNSYLLELPPDLPSGRYALQATLMDQTGAVGANRPLPLVALTIRYRQRLFDPPAIQHPMDMQVGEVGTLLGYDLSSTEVYPGDTVVVTLYWRSAGPSKPRYVGFVHLLDEEGQLQAQRDSVPAGGERPTTGWIEGEIIIDPYEVSLDPAIAPGTYQIEVGMYDPENGARLPIVSGDAVGRDSILLDQKVRVVAP